MSLLQRMHVARALGDIVPPYSRFSGEETDGFHSRGRERIGQKGRREERRGEKKKRRGEGRKGKREGGQRNRTIVVKRR